jgi:hypothetical protein
MYLLSAIEFEHVDIVCADLHIFMYEALSIGTDVPKIFYINSFAMQPLW